MEGKGSATITDMTVDLILNKEKYEDIYPKEEEDSGDNEDEEADSEPENEVIKRYKEESEKLDDLVKEASDEQLSANSRLNILEQYGTTVAKSSPEDLSRGIEQYKAERKSIFEDHTASVAKLKKLQCDRALLDKETRKAREAARREKVKADKVKSKKAAEKLLALQEKQREAQQLKDERVAFWPKKVYRVVLSLETNVDFTPGPSRRGSLSSLAKPTLPPPSPEPKTGSDRNEPSSGEDACEIGLAISYITYSASWSPRYDLNLSTTTRSAMITYRADFLNKTSESWRDAKIILSTSQTAFQGLGELIPTMEPWHISLTKGHGSNSMDDALFSRNEVQTKSNVFSMKRKSQEPRSSLFGLATQNTSLFQQQQNSYRPEQPLQFQQQQQQPPFHAQSSSVFGQTSSNLNQSNAKPSLFGASQLVGSSSTERSASAGTGLFGSAPSAAIAPRRFAMRDSRMPRLSSEESIVNFDFDTETIIPQDATIDFEESSWEETGLTATYDVPGLRSIPPSHLTRRHRIASINLKEIQLSYVLVPKLRAAAFLKARLRNSSTITLLRGPAGLTLDGSFLGNTTLPRCSAGEVFNLNLGTDPAINVVYSKPVVRRSQTGVFSKEGSCVFTRSVLITNTKSKDPLEGIVLDQIPVSEDEKLRVDILQPKGLRNEGDQVLGGAAVKVEVVSHGTAVAQNNNKNNWDSSASSSSSYDARSLGKEEKWGRAVATLKKGGEIRWNVKLNPGQSVRLVTEYETKFPSSERIVGLSR